MGVWPRYRYRRPTPGRRAQRAGPGLDHRPLPQGWALIAFPAAAVAAGAALFLTPRAQALDAGLTSPALRRAGPVTSAVLLAFAASNPVACFFLQGFARQMPGDPTGYGSPGPAGRAPPAATP
ncbi:hypothetical protein [Streptomyces sp. KS 21]|uniref:hypothetical protein n=1 Tax=Streptomyces sp. KS 21 TaxID=2485150 RepID=UPI0010637D78|nr:hypothetical protein [Streptomyces sp. KS 21]TDU76730.1 hypothetical protein EDD91_3447 [Streptomyces sp. KS 21]